MIDVHAPHHTPNGTRDFFIHLFTITVGLLIAVGIEGAVEWQHHRHLAHDAETSMTAEIRSNAKGIQETLDSLHKEQASLKHDVIVLNEVIKTNKEPEHEHMDISFHIHTFDSLAWTTAETTGALAYMPYGQASEFAGIYKAQEALSKTEEVAARDAAVSLGPFLTDDPKSPPFNTVNATEVKRNIQIQQGQLLIVDSFMKGLDAEYKKFLAEHP